ncbi:MAG: DJ-1/PfpI family protein [Ruminococcaceae bacterium]|nr:DJ-1/PfpI family protein [Oscillospiraceae bacterium]
MTYVFLADGFEEIEALAVVDILRRCKIAVETVSITDKKQVTGAHGISVIADTVLSAADMDKANALILPGGLPGADNLQACAPLAEALCKADRENRIVAAICAAPKVLGALGITKGKRATCYPGYEQTLSGAVVVAEKVAWDGHVITSRGAGTASDFAFCLAEALGVDPASVRQGMQFD